MPPVDNPNTGCQHLLSTTVSCTWRMLAAVLLDLEEQGNGCAPPQHPQQLIAGHGPCLQRALQRNTVSWRAMMAAERGQTSRLPGSSIAIDLQSHHVSVICSQSYSLAPIKEAQLARCRPDRHDDMSSACHPHGTHIRRPGPVKAQKVRKENHGYRQPS